MDSLNIDDVSAARLISAATTTKTVKGLTHDFYRYPARFSPLFIRQAIETFTEYGDLVVDPFIGGGTTAVEARILGRRSIGTDINTLATFVSKVKTTPLNRNDIFAIQACLEVLPARTNLRNKASFAEQWQRYHKNIDTKEAWPIRKAIQLALDSVDNLTLTQSNFVRCCILRSSQWAFDMRKEIPSVDLFRKKLMDTSRKMLASIEEFSLNAKIADSKWDSKRLPRTSIINRNSIGLEHEQSITKAGAPKLVLTSPPYPGVHVLYHRWQIKSRRETPAAYWIADELDGLGESHYTFGNREELGLSTYFNNVLRSFQSIAKICDKRTKIVQVIAFSDPSWQLPLYLDVLSSTGLSEMTHPKLSNAKDGRLWRQVPNRKWFASKRGNTGGSKEVVLIHKLK